VAELKAISEREVAEAVARNARVLYGEAAA